MSIRAIIGIWSIVLGLAGGSETLDVTQWPGAKFHQSVKRVDGLKGPALQLSEGGIECPIIGKLAPTSGSIDLWCRMPADWPQSDPRILFQLAANRNEYISLSFIKGQLRGLYCNGPNHTPPIWYRAAGSWKPESWHRIQFVWMSEGCKVLYLLQVDDYLVGVRIVEPIKQWPDKFFVGIRHNDLKTVWQGLLEQVRISSAGPRPPELVTGKHDISIYADRAVGGCYNFWSTRNFTSQDMFARLEVREGVRQRNPFMKYVNCVRLIGGRTDKKNQFFKGVDADGNIQCDFTLLIEYLQGILDWGYTPRIVLDNVPTAMSDPPQMHKYGNTYPPKDYRIYHAYIKAVVQAMVDAFGMDTVRQWRFRVMTEPDLYPNHWAGTKQEYLKLYDYAVDAVTSVIPDADVGPGNIMAPEVNPHRPKKHNKWALEIVDHAGEGKNYCTGATGTRMRFLSCSWYGQIGRPVDYFELAIKKIRARLDRYPQFHDLPIEVAEFGVLTDQYGKRMWGMDATEWGGSWFAAIADRAYRLEANRIHLWSTTSWGIWHPQAQVISMLERMAGRDRLAVETKSSSAARCGVIACRKDDKLILLVYHHRRFRYPKAPEHITLRIHDKRMTVNQPWTITERRVDANHSIFMHEFINDCQQAGLKPVPDKPIFAGQCSAFGREGMKLFHKNREKYQALAELQQIRSNDPIKVGDSGAVLELNMPAHSVSLLEIESARKHEN
ncbi:MAG: GH39 family glycosyl hydrolase [Planctomycetota bacterium]